MINKLRRLLIALAFTGVVSAATGQRVAVVVGVGSYPSLDAQYQLPGCESDAEHIATALKRYGFNTTLLVDEQATHDKVLAAIHSSKFAAPATGEFVFYFSGHGANLGEGAPRLILMHDFAVDSQGKPHNGITTDELYAAVSTLHAGASSIILDSCYSGAMMKGLNLNSMKKSGLAVKTVPLKLPGIQCSAARARSGQMPASNGSICYFTAADGAQEALMWNGRSIFTAHLVERLNGSEDIWGDLHRAVCSDVEKEVETIPDDVRGGQTMSPQLSQGFADRLVFKNTPGHAQKLVDLQSVFSLSNPNPNFIRLSMQIDNEPTDEKSVSVNSELSFSAHVGAAGYLVVLNRDVTGTIKVLYPKGGKARSGYVQSGDAPRVPEDVTHVLSPSGPGVENVKAVLFERESDAQAVLDRFGQKGFAFSELSGQHFSKSLNEHVSAHSGQKVTGYNTAELAVAVRQN